MATSLCEKRPAFRPQYAPTTTFLDFQLSPTMGSDHLPDRYLLETVRVWESWSAEWARNNPQRDQRDRILDPDSEKKNNLVQPLTATSVSRSAKHSENMRI